MQKNQAIDEAALSFSLDQAALDPETVNLIPAELARKYRILPLSRSGDRLRLAMADPEDLQAIEDAGLITDLSIDPVPVEEAELERAFHRRSLWESGSFGLAVRNLRREAESAPPFISDRYEAREPAGDPVVELVDSLLLRAVLCGASDIHVDPREQDLRVRLRIDGELDEIARLPQPSAPAVVSRLKILCGLDIAEKRLPQDGRLTTAIDNREISFRASTVPTIHGEKLVLRVLDREQGLLALDDLGLNGPNRLSFDRLLQRPHGLVLVTGPTGSGKTSTLYAILDYLNSTAKSVMTLEDPVEFSLPGVVQIQINPRLGFNFSAGLRSVLRVDPNIIMVGEIRDAETARLAVQAALTGHLVLTTLHTARAAGTAIRLLDMGVDPFALASALTGIVSQRLVRRLCPACQEAYILPGTAAQKLGLNGEPSQFFYRHTGCRRCRFTGYRGRMAIQEVLTADQDIKRLIIQGAAASEMEAAARRAGMLTLEEDGLDKARRGLTSIEEVLRTVCLDP